MDQFGQYPSERQQYRVDHGVGQHHQRSHDHSDRWHCQRIHDCYRRPADNSSGAGQPNLQFVYQSWAAPVHGNFERYRRHGHSDVDLQQYQRRYCCSKRNRRRPGNGSRRRYGKHYCHYIKRHRIHWGDRYQLSFRLAITDICGIGAHREAAMAPTNAIILACHGQAYRCHSRARRRDHRVKRSPKRLTPFMLIHRV